MIRHTITKTEPLSVQELPRCRLSKRIETHLPLRAVNAPIPPFNTPRTSRSLNGLGGVRRMGKRRRGRIVDELDGRTIAQEGHPLRTAMGECLD